MHQDHLTVTQAVELVVFIGKTLALLTGTANIALRSFYGQKKPSLVLTRILFLEDLLLLLIQKRLPVTESHGGGPPLSRYNEKKPDRGAADHSYPIWEVRSCFSVYKHHQKVLELEILNLAPRFNLRTHPLDQ